VTRLAPRLLVVATLAAAGATMVQPAPAHAAPSTPCNAANVNTTQVEVDSAEVNPALTQFMAINIAEGTTGVRTETLTRVQTVTVTFNGSAEISSQAGGLFAKVAVKVGLSVLRTSATTDTETTSMTWNFSQPGYYGLYKGTRQVAGSFRNWRCWLIAGRYQWGPAGSPIPYTTFDYLEAGTLRCGDTTPAGSLREQARLALGC
jgi:hypothetical protein